MTTTTTATFTSKLGAAAKRAQVAVSECYSEVSNEVCECGSEFTAAGRAFKAQRQMLKDVELDIKAEKAAAK